MVQESAEANAGTSTDMTAYLEQILKEVSRGITANAPVLHCLTAGTMV